MTPKPVHASRPDAILEIFGRSKVVIGVVHAKALPGSPAYAGEPLEDVYAHAVAEAQRYAQGGVHGLIVENHGDIPFSKPDDLGPETAAVMSVITYLVKKAVGLPIGVNVLANGACQALAVAQASGGGFIRMNQWANAYVANEGFIEGPAARATRYRSRLRAEQKVFADVHVKHGSHAIVADRSLEELTRDLEFFGADAVIVTGQRTGDAAQLDELNRVREATQLPLLVGSGVSVDNVARLFSIADGVIVASALKEDSVWWERVAEAKVAEFMEVVASLL